MSTPYSYEKLDQKDLLKYLFSPEPSATPAPEGCEEIMIPTEDQCELHLRAFPSDIKDKPVILFFHGNAEQVSDYTDIAEQFKKHVGASFLAAEYRGYGLATGTPTATNMMHDCQLILDRALQWKNDNEYAGKFLVMGRSLGCVSAIELVHNNPEQIDALLIDSGFAYTLPVLETVGVDTAALNLTESDCFNNLEKIKHIDKPLYVIHGAKDDLILVDNASTLVSEALSIQKELQLVPGATHNSIFADTGKMYYEIMNRFIKGIGIMRKKKVGVR